MKLLLLLGTISALLLSASPGQAQKIIEKTASLRDNQRLVLELPFAAAIRIKGVSGKEVAIKATISINNNRLNDALLLTMTTVGNAVEVKSAFDEALLGNSQKTDCVDSPGSNLLINNVDGKGQGGYRICLHVDYEVEVPADVSLTVNTMSGNIQVTGLKGALEAKSFGGFVDVSWPPSSGAEVSLSSNKGTVYTNQDIALDNKNAAPTGQLLRGKLGRSGPAVTLESYGGDIFFRKQN
ncbi:hypothetical protein [Hymenobacter arizonensis]|uniref:Adhesin domain-containing protein n=1 Tax=Hymenobacter arizonensis TaxID=1227077 RepID=A0A1I6BJ02_HYMAR|nr:hypothetical protein [Hymenobacter arizonensis]SFQ80884.1 hypothetical protein SAMN04515668_4589 [Hymenobacter arizonensis]